MISHEIPYLFCEKSGLFTKEDFEAELQKNGENLQLFDIKQSEILQKGQNLSKGIPNGYLENARAIRSRIRNIWNGENWV